MTRKNNVGDMTIQEQIEAIKETLCYEYCKHTEAYLSIYKDPDEAQKKLLADMCQYCVMNRL